LKNVEISASGSEVVSDFHLWKDLIYADLNLADPRIVRLFRDLYSILGEQTPLPSLLVFLSASTDLIVERIERRRRDFELRIDPGYFAKVNCAYEGAFAQYSGRKLSVPMDRWDFVSNPNLFEELSLLAESRTGGFKW
jgi:deoxyguanosine kinase